MLLVLNSFVLFIILSFLLVMNSRKEQLQKDTDKPVLLFGQYNTRHTKVLFVLPMLVMLAFPFISP